MLNYLNELSLEKDAVPVRIALAWILHQKPYIVPVPDMKKRERLVENKRAAEIVLSAEELRKIDSFFAHL